MSAVLRWMNSLVKRTRVVRELQDDLFFLKAALALADAPFSLKEGGVVFLPALADDGIQRDIYRTGDFTAKDTLQRMNPFIPENAVILDVGANIGNHALYWALRRNARTIHCFEPIDATYTTLTRNIAANDLEGRVFAHHLALGRETGHASIQAFTPRNTGATELRSDQNGGIPVRSLDDVVTELGLPQVQVLKIDVEGFEENVLLGARQLLAQHGPALFIEIFARNFAQIDTLLGTLGYRKKAKLDLNDYLYLPEGEA